MAEHSAISEVDWEAHGLAMPLSCVERVPCDRVRAGAPDLDPLTGLPRGRALSRWIDEAASPAALILFDLDDLKSVNRTYGYAAGDRMLVSVAERLGRLSRSGAKTARLDADRFAVLVMNAEELADVSALIERAFSVLDGPLHPDGAELSIGVSAGVALLPWNATSPAGLLAAAELALAEAKRIGGGCCRLFEECMRPVRPMTATIREDLARACRDGEWVLHYQPQIHEPGRRLDGLEALLRWRHPERGLLSPAHFLADLERDETANEVGRWAIEQACRDLTKLRRAGLAVPRMAINLFANGTGHGTLRADVAFALHENGLSAHDLELEITEGVVLDRHEALLADLRILRANGVHIALDDFGTGFACLATLRDLPITCLKIDRSFVRDLRPGSTDLAVVRALVALGRDLNLRVVAEGVETARQVTRLTRLGCRVFQGYRYAPAMAADELVARGVQQGPWPVAPERNPQDMFARSHHGLARSVRSHS